MEATTDTNADEYAEKAAARAKWEGMEFAVPAGDTVTVTNVSHGRENAADHRYTVTISGPDATACDCPAAEHYPGKCKHQRAVEANPAVIAAAARATPTATECDACTPYLACFDHFIPTGE